MIIPLPRLLGRCLFTCFFALLAVAPGVRAQNIVLKTGQVIAASAIRRSGDTIMAKVQVGTRVGEVGYQVSAIAKVDFPEPPQIAAGADLLSQGQPGKALAELMPIVNYYEPFKEVAGSWWSKAALLKITALTDLKRDGEADALAQQIVKFSPDPDASRAAQLRLAAALVRHEDYDKANEIADTILKDSDRPDVLADAWVTKGNALLAKKEWTTALLAYLHVPVFYPEEKSFLPAALLGSGRAYGEIDDLARAEKSYNELTTAFPSSPEAAAAKAELAKLAKK